MRGCAKILPDAFAADPERLARFEREAKTLASLNHPNVAAIYAVEKSAGLHALVMELVEGDDLQCGRVRAYAGPTLGVGTPRLLSRRRPCAGATQVRAREPMSSGRPALLTMQTRSPITKRADVAQSSSSSTSRRAEAPRANPVGWHGD